MLMGVEMKSVIDSRLWPVLILLCAVIFSCTSSPTEPVDKSITKIYSLNSVGDTNTHYCIKYAEYDSLLNFQNTDFNFYSWYFPQTLLSTTTGIIVISTYNEIYFFDTNSNEVINTIDISNIGVYDGEGLPWCYLVRSTDDLLYLVRNNVICPIYLNTLTFGEALFNTNGLIIDIAISPDNNCLYILNVAGNRDEIQRIYKVNLNSGSSMIITEFNENNAIEQPPSIRNLCVGNNRLVYYCYEKIMVYSTENYEYLGEVNYPDGTVMRTPISFNDNEQFLSFDGMSSTDFYLFDSDDYTFTNYYTLQSGFYLFEYIHLSDGIYYFGRHSQLFEMVNLSAKETVKSFVDDGAYSFVIVEE